MSEASYNALTLVYHQKNGMALDLYLPSDTEHKRLPLIIYFHGGGLIYGGKGRDQPNFPYWLLDKAHAKGYAFAAASYSLLPQATAFDMLSDVKALFGFLSQDLAPHLPSGLDVDTKRIAVVGQSAGGYICRLAAAHAKPKPCAMGLLWGQGMHLTDHWLKPQFPLIYTRFGPKPRNLMQDWMEEGLFLDHLSGQSISTKLRSLSVKEREQQLDPALRPIFPDLEARSYPPTYFLHGAEDSLVLPEDSINTHRLLQEFGIETQLRVIPHAEHTMRWTKTEEGKEWSVPDLKEELDAVLEFVSTVLEGK